MNAEEVPAMAPAFVVGMLKGIYRGASAALWRALPSVDGEIFELRPPHLTLEFTNLCNANCVFCPYSLQTRAHERMSEAIFKKAVSDYVTTGGGSVDLTPVVGDPLIHPDFVKWVRYLRSIPQIDRITVTTNGILLARHGINAVLDCGLSRINISMAGFDEAMYRRVYQSDSYKKVLANVTELLAQNSKRSNPVPIFLCLRPDKPRAEVMADPDLQPLLRYSPKLEFAEVFSRSGGLMQDLPAGMRLAPVPTKPKRQPCRNTFTGIVVQSNGDVQVCGCESSVNATDLIIGNLQRQSLQEIWRSAQLRAVRQSFTNGCLNSNCSNCDYYYQPPDFHTPEMRRTAKISRRRLTGEIVRHEKPVANAWQME
jgi:radical SAM protein with 4Fe4S-binding SPASM domain